MCVFRNCSMLWNHMHKMSLPQYLQGKCQGQYFCFEIKAILIEFRAYSKIWNSLLHILATFDSSSSQKETFLLITMHNIFRKCVNIQCIELPVSICLWSLKIFDFPEIFWFKSFYTQFRSENFIRRPNQLLLHLTTKVSV